MTARALILDDDPWASALFAQHLQIRFPSIEVAIRAKPAPSPGFDLYVIDNEFEGTREAARLAGEIRRENPDALVIACSATLDADLLRTLINAGCDGVCVKGDIGELEQVLRIAGRHFERRRAQGSGLQTTVHAVTDLLRQWNSRLVRQELTQ